MMAASAGAVLIAQFRALIVGAEADGASDVEHELAEPARVAAGASVLAQVPYELAFAATGGEKLE
jgi:hypothetical protein